MLSLAQRVLSHIQREELLRAGDRVGVAVSGGIDSVALLRLLLELRSELGIVVSVVHFNHKLRGAESDADQEFVANLAREYDLEFYADSGDVTRLAADEHVSIETAAREARYGFFHYLLAEGDPQGLEPDSLSRADGAAGSRALSKPAPSESSPDGEVKIPILSQKAREGWGNPGRALSKPTLVRLDKIVTGHTLDDQAETVLMRMIRGAGLRGLGGIHPRLSVEDDDEVCGEIIRPLLAVRRHDLEQYLKEIGQSWREDSSNADGTFTRNRVRKLLVPLLEKEFNPAVAENLAELAEIARGEEDYWENEVSGWLGTTVQWSEPDWARATSDEVSLIQIGLPNNQSAKPPAIDNDLQSRIDNASWLVANASVSRAWLVTEPMAVQRRLVKAIGEHAGIPLEFKHVEEVLRFAAEEGASGKELSLPLRWRVVRELDALVFVTPDLREHEPPQDYEYDLSIPAQRVLPEAGLIIELRRIPAGMAADAGYNPDHLLDAESLPGPLRVRNWRPGDRFWPAHTKSPKKIKELLQERQVAQPKRAVWPVILSGDEIVWVLGFPVPAKYRAQAGRPAISIVEMQIAEKPLAENDAT